jgi:hypothetical protein
MQRHEKLYGMVVTIISDIIQQDLLCDLMIMIIGCEINIIMDYGDEVKTVKVIIDD